MSDPIEAAKAARLRYVSDNRPGIRREKDGDAFRYIDIHGEPVTDAATLNRIRSLGIPPAYTDVWICPIPNGHLQATGRDAKGRKQYRYHPRWRETRDETKYSRMLAFGDALPRIRERVDADLGRPGLSREKALATVVKLLETTSIRVGNDEYAKESGHVGLTTMPSDAVEVGSSKIRFHFIGKSGKEHDIGVRDPRLARIVKRMRDLPGHDLFQYVDENGERHGIDSGDVNEYLREISGEDFTAKDFRTWNGTVLCAAFLQSGEPFTSESQAKKNIVAAIKQVSAELGNTPAICRKCYVHPAILDSYLAGSLAGGESAPKPASGLRTDEAGVLNLLRDRLQ